MDSRRTKAVHIFLRAEATKNEKGIFFENIIGQVLRKQRFRIEERIRFTGMEIDLFARHSDTGYTAVVECKFIAKSISADVIDKLLGKGFRKKANFVYLVSTAPLGKEARGVVEELKAATWDREPRLVYIGPDELLDIFCEFFGAFPPAISDDRSATLVLSPDCDPFWLLRARGEGGASAWIRPLSLAGRFPFATTIALLLEHGIAAVADPSVGEWAAPITDPIGGRSAIMREESKELLRHLLDEHD